MDTETTVDIIGVDDDAPIGSDKPADGNPEQRRETERPSGNAGIPTIDPFRVTGNAPNDSNNSGSATGGRKRGRPPGSRNKAGSEKAQVSSDSVKISIDELLISIHEMVAAFCGMEELEIDADEAKQGAHHIKKISELYNHTFNPATLVWMGFVMWILTVYGTRGVAIYKRVTSDVPKEPVVVKPKPENKPGPVAVPNPKITNPSQLWDQAPETEYH